MKHLLDIPDYHPNAFKHVGDRRIRLYGPEILVAAADAAAPAVVAGLGEAAVADAALTEAAGASTLADGTVVTAGGTALNSATAADAASTVDASTVSADASTPTELSSSANTGSGLNPNAPSGVGLQGTGNVPGLSSMGGATGLTVDASTLPQIGALDSTASDVGTLSESGLTAPGSNPILDQQITASSGIPSNLMQKALNQGMKKMMQPFPTTTKKTVSCTTSAPVQQPLLPNYIQPASSPLTGTNLYSSSNQSPSLYLSPLQSSGLTPSQQNKLYDPNAEILGATTTPNIVTGSAQPTNYIFPAESRVVGFKDGGGAHVPEFITGHTGHYAQGRGTGQSDDIPALLKDGDYVMDADIVAALGDGSNKAGAEALHHFMNQFPHKHYEGHSTGGHISAMIADGEFVFPSSLVTALGGGSNKEGAKKLDEMREKIREHKRSASVNKIPPKAKSPLSYMEGK